MTRNDPHYFGAGPALIPTDVLEQATKELFHHETTGVGIAEIPHLTPESHDLIKTTSGLIKQAMDIPDDYEVLFLQGGASTGFSVICSNLTSAHLTRTGKLGRPWYLVSGRWSMLAYEEAKRLGYNPGLLMDCKVADEQGKYGKVPPVEQWQMPEDLSEVSYVYYCDNETADGVEFNEGQFQFPFEKFPGVEIVGDMSSNIMSKVVNVNDYGVIYAGAQKNVGIAGLTIYIIKKSIIDSLASVETLLKAGTQVPPMVYDFKLASDEKCTHNTIPLFPLMVIKLMVAKLVNDVGGVAKQEKINKSKSDKVYAALERHTDIYQITPGDNVRSRMNIVFQVKFQDGAEKFIADAHNVGLFGLKGHFSLGGIRISLYNSITEEMVDKLIEFIDQFANN